MGNYDDEDSTDGGFGIDENIAMFVMINKEGKTMNIENNTDKYAIFFYQLTTSAVFVEYKDEVIEYCHNNMDEAFHIFVTC